MSYRKHGNLKIAFLLPSLCGGGAERISLDLAHEFQRMGHSPVFVLMDARGELLDEALSICPVHDLVCDRALRLIRPLSQYLRCYRPDVLLVAMWPLTVLAPIAQILSGYRCPVVIAEHNTLSIQYAKKGLIYQLALKLSVVLGYRLASQRVSVSEGVAEDMVHLSKMRRSSITVIHNPIPLRPAPATASLYDAEKLWSIPQGRRILAVGSLKAQKNYSLLLRAFADIKQSDTKLLILGQGPEHLKLQRLSSQLCIAERVVFAGFRHDPTPFYATADLMVLSSNHEGLPTVLIEALSQGLPVVSTNCPSGPAEILKNGHLGYLVPVGDSTAMATAIDTALSVVHDRDLLRSRASDFSPESAACSYLNLFSLLN